jgi:hypothetical protein
MKVLTMRAPSESGAGSGVASEVGGSGAAAISASLLRFEGILVGSWRRHKRFGKFAELTHVV